MKKTLLTILLFYAFTVNAQESIIKLNLSGLGFRSIGIQYERTLGAHSAIALGLNYVPVGALPKFVTDQDSTGNMESLTYTGWSFTPEYRYYLSGKAPKGFYLAPYFRYSTFGINEIILKYNSTTTGEKKEVHADGTYKSTTVGLMLGAQWQLSEHFTFDWWILGAGFGTHKAEVTALGSFSPTDVQDIKDELADIDLPGDLTYNVNSNSVYIKYDPEVPGVRGFGLCLGYKF